MMAYGRDDLAESASCEFLLDYEEEEDENAEFGMGNSEPKRRRKKKPWRYRWPDDFRDEVLARLLELNEQRHKEEQLTGAAAEPKPKKKKAVKKKATPATKNPTKPKKGVTDTAQSELF